MLHREHPYTCNVPTYADNWTGKAYATEDMAELYKFTEIFVTDRRNMKKYQFKLFPILIVIMTSDVYYSK